MVTVKTQKIKNSPKKKQAPRRNVPKAIEAEVEIGKEPLTQDEVTKLINSTESIEDRALMILGFTTGMKASEIASLEMINFEFSTGIVRIWDKRRHHYRSVCITDEAINEIRVLIDIRKDAAGPRLFPHTARAIEAKFQKHSLRTIGKSRSWESVRRTYISTSARLDMPIRIVVENTGELPASVLKYYMATPVSNARRKVNEVVLYPDSPRLMVKSDELKRILERPYVQKIDEIVSERMRLRSALNELKS